MSVYESAQSFYLGKEYDLASGQRSDRYLLYDSKDLTTHALTLGMTGSGKTALGIALLEEAALDHIPSLIIDPKGDMGNLKLLFPDLKSEDFRPWVSQGQADRQGMSVDQLAEAEAMKWREGLADWEQGPDRLAKLRDQAQVNLYTPGSSRGQALSLLKSLERPSDGVMEDLETLNDYASSRVQALLGLLGMNEDPMSSPKHILLHHILLNQWEQGNSLDLPTLIRLIQEPGITQFGALSLEEFFPAQARQALAVEVNNLLANPKFSKWTQGAPLDFGRMLYTPEGKACVNVFTISHLDDRERMFFVTTFLNEVVSWMRDQTGTSSLRLILYMDEIFGYFPPVANPPSKKPLLNLLKQARAYGLGLVLSSQNPVDLDYKGLSNIGTWFIGRLQTEQDKARLLDGLESIDKTDREGFSKADLSKALSALPPRVFLMNNIHETGPVFFQTRWVMSYLPGPLSLQDINLLEKKATDSEVPVEESVKPASVQEDTLAPAVPAPSSLKQEKAAEEDMPISLQARLPDGIRQVYMPLSQTVDLNRSLAYYPGLYALVETNFMDKKTGISETEKTIHTTVLDKGLIEVSWEREAKASLKPDSLLSSGQASIPIREVPASFSKKTNFTQWEKDLIDLLYRAQTYDLARNTLTGLVQAPGETLEEFQARNRLAVREVRDKAVDDLRLKYQKKIQSAEEKVRKANQAVQREKDQAKQSTFSAMVNAGNTVLNALMGRKAFSKTTMNKASMTARSAGRSRQQAQDVVRAEETLATYEADLERLNQEAQTEMDALSARYEEEGQAVEITHISPKKSDIKVRNLSVIWLPYYEDSMEPAFDEAEADA